MYSSVLLLLLLLCLVGKEVVRILQVGTYIMQNEGLFTASQPASQPASPLVICCCSVLFCGRRKKREDPREKKRRRGQEAGRTKKTNQPGRGSFPARSIQQLFVFSFTTSCFFLCLYLSYPLSESPSLMGNKEEKESTYIERKNAAEARAASLNSTRIGDGIIIHGPHRTIESAHIEE